MSDQQRGRIARKVVFDILAGFHLSLALVSIWSGTQPVYTIYGPMNPWTAWFVFVVIALACFAIARFPNRKEISEWRERRRTFKKLKKYDEENHEQ